MQVFATTIIDRIPAFFIGVTEICDNITTGHGYYITTEATSSPTAAAHAIPTAGRGNLAENMFHRL